MNKLGIEERLHTAHWSSTERSSTNAWIQDFDNGNQNVNTKTYSGWTRAVRRVKKTVCNAP